LKCDLVDGDRLNSALVINLVKFLVVINFHGIDLMSFSCAMCMFYKTIYCSYGVLIW